MEPLGQSQVASYVKSMSTEYNFIIVSLEKPEDFLKKNIVEETQKDFKKFGIEWIPIAYKFGIKGHISNFYYMAQAIDRIISIHNIKLVHCRSYLPTLIIYLIQKRKRKSKRVPYLFDTRGFWVDERADIGEWKRGSILYRLFKRLERRLYLNAHYVVMLSEKSIEIIQENKLFEGGNKIRNISCIPTCTNLKLFHTDINSKTLKRESPLIVGYVGNVISWYDFDSTIQVVKKIAEIKPIEFRIYNSGQHDYIHKLLSQYEVTATVERVPFDSIPEKLRELDISVFFIKPFFSKQASAATKLGELLASGVSVITNGNVGDHQKLLESSGAGWIMDPGEIETTDFNEVILKLVNPQTILSCQELALSYFSLEEGVNNYLRIYKEFSL